MSHTSHAPLLSWYSSVRTAESRPVLPAVAVAPLPLEERATVLEAAVSRARDKGAELETHTATVAVVVYPGDNRKNIAHLLLTFLRLRLGLFTRSAATSERVKSSRMMLTVDECGNVTRWALPR